MNGATAAKVAAVAAKAAASAPPPPPARALPLRVVSLLPSATENVCALLEFCATARSGGAKLNSPLPQLVGRSHECDYPSTPDVQSLPVLTAARTAFTSSADTHNQVRQALQEAASLYHLDAAKLSALAPDVILTQSTCKVCSIDLATVEASLDPLCAASPAFTAQEMSDALCSASLSTSSTPHLTQIVTTNPTSLLDALVRQFEEIGDALGVREDGCALAQENLRQLKHLQTRAHQLGDGGREKPRVLMVEWLDPLFIGKMGWMRDLVEAAGGTVVESLDEDSAGKIDVVVVALCGLDLAKTQSEIKEGKVGDWWFDLLGDKRGDLPAVYLVDGTSMFTRPTRRLLSALEWLVNVLHDPEGEWTDHSAVPFVKYDVSSVASSKSTTNGKSAELLEIEELHRVACANKQATYIDPATGYTVMTAYILKERQVCCGNGCRHCPYGHANVKDPSRRKNALRENVLLNPRRIKALAKAGTVGGRIMWPEGAKDVAPTPTSSRDNVVMFWSGGKDSFLALSYLYASYSQQGKPMPQVVLLTTIDPETNGVPIQNIDVQTVAAQAEALELPIFMVSVGLGAAYASCVCSALLELPTKLKLDSITALAFGDLHLQDIREWREATFAKDYSLLFPIWKKDYRGELLPALDALCQRSGARLFYSNVDTDRVQIPSGDANDVKIGSAYDWKSVEALNGARDTPVDLMGECGEFHTCVKFPGMH